MTASFSCRTGFGIFFCFLLATAAFNRGFAYLHVTVGHVWPFYVTEICLAALLLSLAFCSQPFRDLLKRPQEAIFIKFLVLFFLIAFLKILLAKPYISVLALRQAAMGWYPLFAIFALLYFPAHKERILTSLLGVSVISTAIMMVLLFAPQWTMGPLMREFHGLAALMWMGIVSFFLIAYRKVNFWAFPKLTLLVVVYVTIAFLAGSRSLFLGLMGGIGIILYLSWRSFSAHERRTYGIFLGVVLFCLTLRSVNLIRFGDQEIWSQSWHSLKSTGATLSSLYETKRLSMDPEGENAAFPPMPPQESVHYFPSENRLALQSHYLNRDFLARHSSKENNMIWRVELWRLACLAVLKENPLMGFPLGLQINYLSFVLPWNVTTLDLHNSHLTILFRFGLWGMAIYLGVIFFVFKAFAKALKTSRRQDVLPYGISLLFIMFLASFNVVLEGPYCAPVFWSLLGAGFSEFIRKES